MTNRDSLSGALMTGRELIFQNIIYSIGTVINASMYILSTPQANSFLSIEAYTATMFWQSSTEKVLGETSASQATNSSPLGRSAIFELLTRFR